MAETLSSSAGGDRLRIVQRPSSTNSPPPTGCYTATRSGYEQNYTRFGKYISGAVADPQAIGQGRQTSLLEAFLMASRRVAEFYESAGRLATNTAAG